VEIDPDRGTILNRYPFPGPGLPNDVCASDNGELYITDSFKGLIYRLKEGKMEIWLESPELARVNAILYDHGRILAGTSTDGCVRIIDPETKNISLLASIGSGSIIDGLVPDGQGNYLVGDFNGKVYRVTPAGEKKLLINTHGCSVFRWRHSVTSPKPDCWSSRPFTTTGSSPSGSILQNKKPASSIAGAQ